jgi:TRAP-type uncharacterized transport system substrate-binding protein
MKIAGIVVSGNTVTIVIVGGTTAPFDCESEEVFTLQTGDRAPAYSVMLTRVADFLKQHGVEKTIFKASAVSGQGGQKEVNLLAAELRGVVQVAAINAQSEVKTVKKSLLSKERTKNVDDYVKDDGFWVTNLPQLKKKTLRTAALLAVLDRI